jgi:hypothetical protein
VGTRAQTSPTPSPTPSSSPSLEKDFFKNILRDQKAIWTSPAHVHGKDAPWLFMLGMTAGGFLATDRATGDDMARHTGQLDASRIISYAGSIYGVSAAAGSFYLMGRVTHNQRARETGILAAEAIIDSGIVVTALKEITQRARPLTSKAAAGFSSVEVHFSVTASKHGRLRRWSPMSITINLRFRSPLMESPARSAYLASPGCIIIFRTCLSAAQWAMGSAVMSIMRIVAALQNRQAETTSRTRPSRARNGSRQSHDV